MVKRAAFTEAHHEALAGRLAVPLQWVSTARVQWVHVADGVDAVAAVAGAGRLADVVRTLVADRVRFQKIFLDLETDVDARQALVRPPLRDALAVSLDVLDRFVEAEVYRLDGVK